MTQLTTDQLLKLLSDILHPDSVYSTAGLLYLNPDELKAIRAQLLAGREAVKALEATEGCGAFGGIKVGNRPSIAAKMVHQALTAARDAGIMA